MKNPSSITSLSGFLTPQEMQKVTTIMGHARPHPIFLLLERENGTSQHRVNVDIALRQVSNADRAWLDRMKPRMIGQNVTEASAALAELRAYGYLLGAGFSVTPVAPTKKMATPEFEVRDGNDRFIVEVHAKQQNTKTEEDLERHRAAVAETHREPGRITTHVHVVHPWGRPSVNKPGDSTTKNAISKICAIKGSERQLRSDMSSIVWMDFQDLHTLDMALTAEQFSPLLSSQEHITSGAIWYALYGWKGAPVFEHVHYSHLDLPSQIQRMEHDGRFRLSNVVSAVIVSLPNATLLAETPRKERQLPPSVRLRFLGLPHAGIQHSIAEWSAGQVAATLIAGANSICALVAEKPPTHYPDFVNAPIQRAAHLQLGRKCWGLLTALAALGLGFWMRNRRKDQVAPGTHSRPLDRQR